MPNNRTPGQVANILQPHWWQSWALIDRGYEQPERRFMGWHWLTLTVADLVNESMKLLPPGGYGQPIRLWLTDEAGAEPWVG